MGAKNYANVLQILILKYSCEPEKLSGLSRNRLLNLLFTYKEIGSKRFVQRLLDMR